MSPAEVLARLDTSARKPTAATAVSTASTVSAANVGTTNPAAGVGTGPAPRRRAGAAEGAAAAQDADGADGDLRGGLVGVDLDRTRAHQDLWRPQVPGR